ncbi:transporter [Flavobacterium pectinovorum]|uniref:Transporter n=1 Tax=Flavobacterium pectinovorum TaxID=29533 RepID=A0A502ECT7_9FLAO|nr:transporter [Flavobacterium pectinovorum]TPG34819.1 transporter [Flavobacterium pectinovorum]
MENNKENNKLKIKGHLLFLMLFLGIISTVGQSNNVSPMLTGHYLPGIINVRDFANPAPATGLIALDYNVFLSGNKFYGADGKRVTQITGPLGAPINLNVDINGYLNSPFLLWVSKFKILGAAYITGLTAAYTTVSTSSAYERIRLIDSIHQSGTVNGKVNGFSDLGVMPVFLSWGLKMFDITAGYMFYAPTGEYEPGGSNNTGLGYWSHLVQGFAYYYPLKINGETSKALACMLASTYEITSKMEKADVNPGNRFYLDYGISQYFSDKFSLGIFGGNSWQVSQDEGNGVYWNSHIKDRIGVLGFEAGYWPGAGRVQITGKYGFNYGAVQSFKMNTFEINLLFITNALTGNKL